jgi:hypothetical protein
MALIERFTRIDSPRTRVHRTLVECGYAFVDSEHRRYLQLETYGSDERQIPGKVSQTLQLNEDAARELLRLLHEAFPELSRKS